MERRNRLVSLLSGRHLAIQGLPDGLVRLESHTLQQALLAILRVKRLQLYLTGHGYTVAYWLSDLKSYLILRIFFGEITRGRSTAYSVELDYPMAMYCCTSGILMALKVKRSLHVAKTIESFWLL